jgi:hypothetical protein
LKLSGQAASGPDWKDAEGLIITAQSVCSQLGVKACFGASSVTARKETPMDQIQSQKGNFIAWFERSREPGSKQPSFTGRLSIPGREQEHGLSVWTRKDRFGRPYFFGSIDGMPVTEDALAQIEKLANEQEEMTGEILDAGYNIQLAPRQFVMFANKYREPNAQDTAEQAAKRTKQNHFWGRLNPGDGSPVVALAMWVKQDKRRNPMLTGSTEYPLPGLVTDVTEQEPSLDEIMTHAADKSGERDGRTG